MGESLPLKFQESYSPRLQFPISRIPPHHQNKKEYLPSSKTLCHLCAHDHMYQPQDHLDQKRNVNCFNILGFSPFRGEGLKYHKCLIKYFSQSPRDKR